MTEYDGSVMNVEQWADYWHAGKADIVFVSVIGILAFYPSRVKFHRHGKFLKGRDLFGECASATKKRGMRVVPGMSPISTGQMLSQRILSGRCGTGMDLYSTTTRILALSDLHVFQLHGRLRSRHHARGELTLRRGLLLYKRLAAAGQYAGLPLRHLQQAPPSDTRDYWCVFTDRVLALWRKYDAIAKEKIPIASSSPIRGVTYAVARSRNSC